MKKKHKVYRYHSSYSFVDIDNSLNLGDCCIGLTTKIKNPSDVDHLRRSIALMKGRKTEDIIIFAYQYLGIDKERKLW